jgi:hypothetical protein
MVEKKSGTDPLISPECWAIVNDDQGIKYVSLRCNGRYDLMYQLYDKRPSQIHRGGQEEKSPHGRTGSNR